MASAESVAVAHADKVTGLQTVGLMAGRRSWQKVNPADITSSWMAARAQLAPVVESLQLRAATAGAEYGVDALAAQGLYRAPGGFVDPSAFVGFAPDGRSLDGLLRAPEVRAKFLIGRGVDQDAAITEAGKSLDKILRSIVADTSRQAASVDIVTRHGVGYVRQLVGTSCPECVILAGKFYRWNAGFLRHPNDDCIHVPTTGVMASDHTTDPYKHFDSMTEAEQDEFWGKADAQAIRDGGDIFQIQNAHRKRAKDGLTTLEGTSRRGEAAGLRRLTPDAIYAQARNREEALALLEKHKYILPGGQNPIGSIRGQREGYGQLGRGGARVGARLSVVEARRTGRRSAGSRYTATAAELRVIDSTNRWHAVQQGRNPFTRNGKGLTPAISAQVEKDYRRMISSAGQKFTK